MHTVVTRVVARVDACPRPAHIPIPFLLADWVEDRTGVHCALVRAIEEMPRRDEFVDLLRDVCAHFEDDGLGIGQRPRSP